MPELKYTDNVQEWTRKLRRAGFAIQEAAAGACTFAAESVAREYREKIKTETIRMRSEKFTLRAVVVYPAKYTHSGGKLRPMHEINAVVGVRQMAGGKEHYLAMLEVGADKRSAGTIPGVPIPTDAARGGARSSAVKGGMRLGKGAPYGGTIDVSRFMGNPRQQVAIIASMARRGKLKAGSYYAVDHGDKKWLYKVTGKGVMLTRDISEDVVKIQANPMFTESVSSLGSNEIETYFSRAALILMGTLE